MTADPHARWAELLPGPTDAPNEAAAAFLRGLPDEGFLPSSERVAAANALAGTAAPVGRAPDVERLLRDELGTFAARYWALTPAERRGAWIDLARRGADATRLRELEPGLDVPAPALADPTAEALAALVRALFVMPPRARAIRRNTWLLEHATEVVKWRTALAVVQRDAPALSALEPRLREILALEFGSALAAFVEGASTASGSDPSVARDVADFAARMREYERTGGASPPGLAERADRAYGKLFNGLGIAFVLILVGGLAAGVRSSRESATPQPPAGYQVPTLPPSPERSSYSFDSVAIQACRDYDRGKSRWKPVLYDRWVAAGKPTTPGVYPLAYQDR